MDSPFIIINPAARSGRAGNFVEVLQELPGNPVIRLTTRPREAEQFAREAIAQGYKKIVAAGGDGLINEVVNGIVSFDHSRPLFLKPPTGNEAQVAPAHKAGVYQEQAAAEMSELLLEEASKEATLQFPSAVEISKRSTVALGILPLGTMNVFASELKIPLDSLEAAWEIILKNRSRNIDLACATHLETQQQRFFVQLAGIGLDAEVLEETSNAFKMAFGPISYFFSFLKVVLKKQPMFLLRCKESGEQKGSSILLGNGKFYGGAFPFFPEAALDDGHLHVLLFKHHHFWELLGNLPALLIGKPKALRTVQYFKTKELSVIPQDSQFKIPFELDGEMVSYLPVKISIEKQKLSVLI